MDAPIIFTWDGEAMVPLSRFAPRCDKTYVVGEQYRMSTVEERSLASHNHFFAAVHEYWLNLPDAIAIQFPTPDALRKHALIMTGFRRERKFATESALAARKLAAFLTDAYDDYALISVNGAVVVEWKAMSQSYKAMPEKGQFKRSKDDVLGFCEALVGARIPETEAA